MSEPTYNERESVVMTDRAELMREACAEIAHKRADGFHSSECERGHVEYDTGAFVCSAKGGCLCQEREEEAEAIEQAIRALSVPEAVPDPRDEALAKARDALEEVNSEYNLDPELWDLVLEAMSAIDALKEEPK